MLLFNSGVKCPLNSLNLEGNGILMAEIFYA
jgi:hypothetical protein